MYQLDSNLQIGKLKEHYNCPIPMQQYPPADWLSALLSNYIRLARSCSNPKEAEAAARDMTLASKDPNFIPSAFSLLKRNMRDRDSTILLTSLIKNVFKYDFQDISWNDLNNYYSDLILIARQLSCEAKPILKNISMTLAYIYIHYSSVQSLSVFDFLKPLQPFNLESPSQSPLFLYYFRTLEYIASQISNSKLVVAEEQRQSAKNKAIAQQLNTIKLINNSVMYLSNGPELAIQCLLQCLVCWVNLEFNAQIMNSLNSYEGLELCLKEIDREDGYEGAADCLGSIISSIGLPADCQPLIKFLGYNIPRIVKAAEQRIQAQQFSEAENIIQTIIDYSIKAARTFVKIPSKEIFNFLQRLVIYTGCPDLQIPKSFSRFWQTYLEQLSHIRITQEVDQMVNALIWNLFNALVHTIIYPQHALVEMSHGSQIESIDDSNHENLLARRRKVSLYIFQGMAKVITTRNFFSIVCDCIRILERNRRDFWGIFEALIYSLITPAKKLNFVNDDVNYLLNTYAQISQSPSFNCPKAVLKTFLLVFNSMMTSPCSDHCFISNIFYYITLSLSDPALSRQSDRAFFRACDCRGYLFSRQPEQFSRTLQLYPQRDFVVRGVFTIFLHNDEAIKECLEPNLNFLRDQIVKYPHGSTKRRQITVSLIAACRLLKENVFLENHYEITKRFIRASMPFLIENLTTIQSYDNDEDAEIERTVKLIKHLMRCVTLRFYEFLPQMLECVMNSFQKHPICSYVYLVQIVITVFSKEVDCQRYLLDVYRQFCQICSYHLSDNNKVEKYSFLLDDFIGMNKRLFVYNSSLLLKSGELPRLIDLNIDYMESDTPRVVKAAYSFFQTIFMAYWSPQLIEEFNHKNKEDHQIEIVDPHHGAHGQLKASLQDKIHYIIAKMLDHLARAPAEIIRDCIIDAVTAELAAFPQWNMIIWPQLINPLPNSILVTKQKQYFMGLVESTIKSSNLTTSQNLRNMLSLMLKRMMTANKRRDYHLDN